MQFISNIYEDGRNVSKPFVIKGKKFQMVRALKPEGGETTGVYCYDDINDSGENIILTQEEFEHKYKPNETKPIDHPALDGYKFFYVNKENMAIRKFRSTLDLPKNQIRPDETFMNRRELKQFIGEKLFGTGKSAEQWVMNEDQPEDSLTSKAQKLIKSIETKIPPQAIKSIRGNPRAQKEVILAFAELVNVPKEKLYQIIGDIKSLAGITQNDDNNFN